MLSCIFGSQVLFPAAAHFDTITGCSINRQCTFRLLGDGQIVTKSLTSVEPYQANSSLITGTKTYRERSKLTTLCLGFQCHVKLIDKAALLEHALPAARLADSLCSGLLFFTEHFILV